MNTLSQATVVAFESSERRHFQFQTIQFTVSSKFAAWLYSHHLPNAHHCLQWLLQKVRLLRPAKQRLVILDSLSGVLRPGVLTLLLGPPGCGKSTLLKALSGALSSSLQVPCRSSCICSEEADAPLYMNVLVNYLQYQRQKAILQKKSTCQGPKFNSAVEF